MKLASLVITLVVFGAAIPYAQAQDTETREVYISGIGSDKNEAIKDALSKAVAQVCGQRVSASQNIENDMKSQANYSSDGEVSSVDRTKRSNEKVNALSDGMAEKYEILSETKWTGGTIKLDIIATIGKCFEPNSVADQLVSNTAQTNELLSKMLETMDKKSDLSQADATAVSGYRKAAEQGDADAQYSLGFAYENGRGVTQDYAAAFSWYRKAADQGNAYAQVNLGAMYANGTGVTQNETIAVSWFRKAADQGNADAQYNLGNMYENGTGVTQDYATAFSWYRKAADQGNTQAQYSLGVMYDNGRGVTQNGTNAVSWYRKAADRGYAQALNSLGAMYANARGVTQDYAAAFSWFRKAADQGNAQAQYSLGVMYEEGRGVTQDYAAAFSWFRKAADQGDADAQFNLGYMYITGRGVARVATNGPIAASWFRKAADQGNTQAQFSLGVMYADGIGVTQDYVQALKWYNLGAASGVEQAKTNRDELAAKMTSAQIAEAQRLARAWVKK
jgi:TPR repeat protein